MPFPNESTQFQPGQSGNPDGYSRGRRLTDALIKHFEDKGIHNQFVETGTTEALGGDFNFWKYIFERIDGKIPEPEPEKTGEDAIKDKLRERRAKRKKPDES